MKIFTIIAIIIGLLLVAIISLNFLGAAANKNYTEEVNPNLGNEFGQMINDEPGGVDYGEAAALAQQEALLKEMMGESFEPTAIPKGKAISYSNEAPVEQEDKMQFDNLLNNFQSVASTKPDILARKIQMWLEEDT
jgi:hypothetical protein